MKVWDLNDLPRCVQQRLLSFLEEATEGGAAGARSAGGLGAICVAHSRALLVSCRRSHSSLLRLPRPLLLLVRNPRRSLSLQGTKTIHIQMYKSIWYLNRVIVTHFWPKWWLSLPFATSKNVRFKITTFVTDWGDPYTAISVQDQNMTLVVVWGVL